jgi:hypothetical protein
VRLPSIAGGRFSSPASRRKSRRPAARGVGADAYPTKPFDRVRGHGEGFLRLSYANWVASIQTTLDAIKFVPG